MEMVLILVFDCKPILQSDLNINLDLLTYIPTDMFQLLFSHFQVVKCFCLRHAFHLCSHWKFSVV